MTVPENDLQQYEIRYVEWTDSTAQTGWTSVDRIAELIVDRCVTVGFVFKEDEDQLAIVQSFTTRKKPDSNVVDATIVIPKFAITRAWTVREGKPYYAG